MNKAELMSLKSKTRVRVTSDRVPQFYMRELVFLASQDDGTGWGAMACCREVYKDKLVFFRNDELELIG